MLILQATNINKCDRNIESKVTPDRVKATAALYLGIFKKTFHEITKLTYMKISKIKSKINPLSANPTKWSNILKQFVGNLPTNCLSVFDHFVILTLKGLSTRFIKLATEL